MALGLPLAAGLDAAVRHAVVQVAVLRHQGDGAPQHVHRHLASFRLPEHVRHREQEGAGPVARERDLVAPRETRRDEVLEDPYAGPTTGLGPQAVGVTAPVEDVREVGQADQVADRFRLAARPTGRHAVVEPRAVTLGRRQRRGLGKQRRVELRIEPPVEAQRRHGVDPAGLKGRKQRTRGRGIPGEIRVQGAEIAGFEQVAPVLRGLRRHERDGTPLPGLRHELVGPALRPPVREVMGLGRERTAAQGFEVGIDVEVAVRLEIGGELAEPVLVELVGPALGLAVAQVVVLAPGRRRGRGREVWVEVQVMLGGEVPGQTFLRDPPADRTPLTDLLGAVSSEFAQTMPGAGDYAPHDGPQAKSRTL